MEKLVRDKVPQIMRAQGAEPAVRVLEVSERIHYLRAKLVEESTELLRAFGRKETFEELADIKEVYDALLAELHFCPQEIEHKQKQKLQSKGGFGQFYAVTFTETS